MEFKYGKVIKKLIDGVDDAYYDEAEYSNVLPIVVKYINFLTSCDLKFIERVSEKRIYKNKFEIQDNNEYEQKLKSVNLDELLEMSKGLNEKDKIILISVFRYLKCLIYDNIIDIIFKHFRDYKNIFTIFDEFDIPEKDYDDYAKRICDKFKFTINNKTFFFSEFKIGEKYQKIVGPANLILMRESYRKLTIINIISDENGEIRSYECVENRSSKIYAYGIIIDEKTGYISGSIQYALERAKKSLLTATNKYTQIINSLEDADKLKTEFLNECENYSMFIQNIVKYKKD